MDDVVHDSLIEHGVNIICHMKCAWNNVWMQCVVEHGVERHLPYVVCVENRGCGA